MPTLSREECKLLTVREQPPTHYLGDFLYHLRENIREGSGTCVANCNENVDTRDKRPYVQRLRKLLGPDTATSDHYKKLR